MQPSISSVQRVLRLVQLWMGLGLGLLLAPIGLSGALLVFSVELDAQLDPVRYAVTGPSVAQKADLYLANAELAAHGARAASLRWPSQAGALVVVLLRGGEAEPGADVPPGLQMAYLDPPTGRVLGVVDARRAFIGRIRSLHADLMVANFFGRQIVGFVGLGLLALAVTGLFLWRRGKGGILQAIGWRRGAKPSFNLHHMTGGWIAAPLAVMALTGAYLGFPQHARGLIASFAELSPRLTRDGAGQGGGQRSGAALPQRPALEPQRVIDLALRVDPGARPIALSLPSDADKLWHVQLEGEDVAPRGATVNDATSAVLVARPQTPGDAFVAWLRRVHEAKHHGPVWRAIGFVCGLGPAVFLVTGVMMWVRRRRKKIRRTRFQLSRRAALIRCRVL